ncbi:MAG: TRAP transporter large permease [Acidimicrobiia bacterium]|nr:TRAP transporter large permease [Acidimicrobiia bacterium]
MSPELVGLLGFVGLLTLLTLRVPVAIAMIAVAIVGNARIVDVDAALARTGADAFQGAASFNLSVIPLFVLMGLLLAAAGLGADAYRALDVFLWRLRGGLAVATLGASALFASVSGSAVASATTMSVVAVPEMRKFGYDSGLSAACAAVGGTLGALIPPSAVLVLYGVLTEEPIGDILLAGIVPGVMTAGLLMITAYLVVLRRPELGADTSTKPDLGHLAALRLVWPVPVIFAISMGGIFYGVFTPTEAGGAGAALALIYGVVTRRLTWAGFVGALSRSVRTSAFIFLLVIAGKIFGFFLSVSRIPFTVTDFVGGLDAPRWLVIAAIFVVYFVLGALMDEIAILIIMTPIVYPVVIDLGYDGVWFGVLTIMMLLTGLITPPVGLITFVVSGVTNIELGKVFRATFPFTAALSLAIGLVIAFPGIVVWLPNAAG